MSFLAKVMVKPWQHGGEIDGLKDELTMAGTASKTGLFTLLAVISSMFVLFIISYYTRSQYPDWEVMKDPGILWFNTLVLVLASVALQMASNAAKRESAKPGYALLAGGVLTLVFIGGQFIAWEQMIAAGYYAQTNPANAFFYLFTGLHALHLFGGLWFMVLLAIKLNRNERTVDLGQSITLCTTYWHYLLLVWLVLFTLFLRT